MKLLCLSRKGIVLESHGFFKTLQRIAGSRRMARAAVVWPFLIVRDQTEYKRPWVMNHERIHLVQNTDLLVLGFILLYYTEFFLARWALGKSMEEAYYWVSAEQEAYLNQHNLGYLDGRRWGAQLKYLRGKKRFRVTDVPGEIELY